MCTHACVTHTRTRTRTGICVFTWWVQASCFDSWLARGSLEDPPGCQESPDVAEGWSADMEAVEPQMTNPPGWMLAPCLWRQVNPLVLVWGCRRASRDLQRQSITITLCPILRTIFLKLLESLEINCWQQEKPWPWQLRQGRPQWQHLCRE